MSERGIVMETGIGVGMYHGARWVVHHHISVGMMDLHTVPDQIWGDHHFLGSMWGVVNVKISGGGEQLKHSGLRHQVGPRACEQWLLPRLQDRGKGCTQFLDLS